MTCIRRDYPDPREDEEPKANDVPPPHIALGGYQQLLRGEPFRGKFRKSFEKPEPFTPGKVEEIYFTMPDVNHTFRRGHRIMVQVQSSWFPLTDRNPQTFVNIPDAKPADFQKATERLDRACRDRVPESSWACSPAGKEDDSESRRAAPAFILGATQSVSGELLSSNSCAPWARTATRAEDSPDSDCEPGDPVKKEGEREQHEINQLAHLLIAMPTPSAR